MSVVVCECGRWLKVPEHEAVRCPGCERLIQPKTEAARMAAGASISSPEDLADEPPPAPPWHKEPPVAASPKPTRSTAPPRREPAEPMPGVAHRMFEALLDPRAIQWLLVLGGVLAVIGLVVWLVSLGVFDNPWVQAVGLGGGTLLLLGAGWYLTLKTRYELAGVALSALACGVAPLNLWFYQAQNLMTVQGHLWIAAVVCCGLYAATIAVLRRPVFIYAMQGGLTLTAMLLLADLGQLNAAWLGVVLVALGTLAVHLERLAISADVRAKGGDGFAFPLIWSGLAQVAVGLIAVLLAQVYGWSKLAPEAVSLWVEPRRLQIEPLLAVGLWLIGAYVSFYAALVPRAGGWLVFPSAICVLLAEVTGLMLFNAPAEVAIALLALTAGAAGLLVGIVPLKSRFSAWAAGWAAGLLALFPVGLGYLLFVRGALPGMDAYNAARPFGWPLVSALMFTFACLTASAWGLRKLASDKQGAANRQAVLFCGAASLLIALAAALRLVGPALWPMRAAILTLVPLGYVLYGLVRSDRSSVGVAYVTLGLMALHLLGTSSYEGRHGLDTTAWSAYTFWLAVTFFEAAGLLLIAAVWHDRDKTRLIPTLLSVAAAIPLGLALAQVRGYVDAHTGWGVPLACVASLGLLAVGRWLGAGSTAPASRIARPIALCASALMAITALITVRNGWLQDGDSSELWPELGRLTLAGVACLGAAALGISHAWRRAFLGLVVLLGGSSLILLARLVDLSAWQWLELLMVSLGVLLLVAGHFARFREKPAEERDPLVDIALWFGSLLTVTPLIAAVLWHRFNGSGQSLGDELLLVTASLVMLATGLAWRLRATTLFGGGALVGYLLLLIASVLRNREVAMGAYLAGAGLTVFLIGLGLSLYRDRLLALPDQIAKREGVFKLLDWR